MAGLQDGAAERLEWLTGLLVKAIAAHPVCDPTGLLFLLRRYTATDREDLRDALGEALSAALVNLPETESGADRARWLMVFTEAGRLSDDARLFAAASALDRSLRAGWRSIGSLAEAAEGVEACLVAAGAAASRDLLQSAVDELERRVGASYRPGEGVGDRGLGDQVAVASALLTAFALTGRLPYSMLAEELMQSARRTRWDESGGGFRSPDGSRPFAENCGAVRVCCRLASLHGDEEYRRTAVVARDTTYMEDAELALASQGAVLDDRGLGAAAYGLALAEWLHVKGDLK